uniref:Uncharacterized protein n=1 Tax=Chromera velia CCMP2878 TaxID=1169474 RepID=A0A0G4HXW4_9ALVE|eukprot:Cvel_33324.t1-p1 / transcript=Cvel_33324.t1 / gene=Cvel_33324 / organism=Chromera_velia_CCMP2878 / gene_product=LYR motif-containing protein 4, putative / transcript_product=LYR motif-containing protein 4, putative / location=Cvel_scaffold5381:2474-2848(-) / protein_length=88 / sequence_SO=supercontig / SO=protein_coding / is_pseudo=false
MSGGVAVSKEVVLMYRRLYKAASHFETVNFRKYFQRRTHEDFRNFVQQSRSEEEVRQFLNRAKGDLEMLQRQTLLARMYHVDAVSVSR